MVVEVGLVVAEVAGSVVASDSQVQHLMVVSKTAVRHMEAQLQIQAATLLEPPVVVDSRHTVEHLAGAAGGQWAWAS